MDNVPLFFDEPVPVPLASVATDAGELRPGDHIVLRPLARADILDIALHGKTATLVSIEQDFEGRVHLAVSVDDDPGNDFAATGQPGHRFFFGINEVERIADPDRDTNSSNGASR